MSPAAAAEKREKILSMVLKGKKQREIADELGVSLSTVGYHIAKDKKTLRSTGERKTQRRTKAKESPKFIDLPATPKANDKCIVIIADVKLVRELVGGSW